uniref:Uncharacterized protein n=1 Tax=Physcomitrium patens TaxID=3218 RepID=A0A2K1IGU3_PHYPA|nr:hypothetical protein PHYPA_029086 [Physcomitrium patens]
MQSRRSCKSFPALNCSLTFKNGSNKQSCAACTTFRLSQLAVSLSTGSRWATNSVPGDAQLGTCPLPSGTSLPASQYQAR